MPRRSRCILPGLPCHVTQRGVDRRETFSSDQDRSTYLRLLRENFEDAQASLLGWCLMSNHATGPRSDAGKERSALNATKHGLRSEAWSWARAARPGA